MVGLHVRHGATKPVCNAPPPPSRQNVQLSSLNTWAFAVPGAELLSSDVQLDPLTTTTLMSSFFKTSSNELIESPGGLDCFAGPKNLLYTYIAEDICL